MGGRGAGLAKGDSLAQRTIREAHAYFESRGINRRSGSLPPGPKFSLAGFKALTDITENLAKAKPYTRQSTAWALKQAIHNRDRLEWGAENVRMFDPGEAEKHLALRRQYQKIEAEIRKRLK